MNPLHRLAREMHRRSLWQVLGIYLVGSWIGYQVILNLMQGFGLPDWVAPFSLVLFLIGLPIVIATAFVQEGLPEKRDFVRSADPHELIAGFSTAADDVAAHAEIPDRAGDRHPASAPARGTLADRHLTWPKAILAGIVAFLVLGFSTAGYMGLRNAGIGPMGTLLGKGEISERDPIVLANFTSAGDDDVLTSALTEAFRVDFEQSPIVRLVGTQQIEDVLRRMQRDPAVPLDETLAREIAEREGYKAVLTGEVNPAGGGYVLSARLLSVDGRVLASARETAADSTEVLPAIDRLSKTVRERIGESLRTIRANPPLEQVTTASVEALRKYTQALAVRDEGDPFRAIELLEQAIAIDSGFAMAYRKIGAITSSPGMDPALRARATTRAYELRDRLTEEEQHLAAAAYYAWVTGDLDAAAREYRSVLDIDPDNTAALNNLSLRLGELGRNDEAAEVLERAYAIGGSAVFAQNYAEVLYTLGRVDQARAVIDSAEARWPNNGVITLYQATLDANEGDFAASDSIVEAGAASGLDPNSIAGLHWQGAGNAAVHGRLREAVRHTRAMERVSREFSSAEALGSLLMAAHLTLALTGDRDAALTYLDDGLARYPLAGMEPLQRPYRSIIGLLLLTGETERAARMDAERVASVPAAMRASLREGDLFIEVLRQLAAGNVDEADAALEEVAPITVCDVCLMHHVAAAHARAGNDARAIQLYERILDDRFFWRVGETDAFGLAPTLLGLAELYERRGDREGAARMYGRFVELWQDADPELQPRVRAARDRLEAIVRQRG